ncbi:proteasome-associated ATPase [Microlunatus endophyticus]|uniref:AAA ATPase forming ring-shaped complexes n=1 Tax=Microlunatus endophyticus TaxID=1716077 RepID=A0A917S2T2_9ACTN|nr:proteasome ATPase [Microlunatus endophyticus]GGL53232.1 proteasome-associated ATPase [Microlunatus endophyticus]
MTETPDRRNRHDQESEGHEPEDVLLNRIGQLNDEVDRLRDRISSHPHDLAMIERRLADARADVRAASANNERLAATLREAREQIISLKAEVDRLAQPPASFGVYLGPVDEATADIWTSGRKMRVSVSPEAIEKLEPGREVILNEALNVVGVLDFDEVGEVVSLKEVMSDGERALIIGHGDEESVVRLADQLRSERLRAGDSLLVDRRVHFAYERVPKMEVEELVLEDVPDIGYEEIGGLRGQIDAIRDAVELPFLYKDLFAEHELKAPKGILLYGPPGCGKTMIAKAVANSLAKKVTERTGREGRSFFLNIKGPELLNKYVGETERHIRLVFQRAREKATDGMPVIVFFDEMDSLFRTRGTGVSSDVENTIVPQLLSEIDGVEGMENVIIIGASNREDMIDPAILRPGRLDVKIKIERPDAEAARDIFSKYLTPTLPLHDEDLKEFDGDRQRTVDAMVERTVARMYDDSEENQFLEVTYAGGDKEILYFKDFNSGAMIHNIVDRAKKMAIKDFRDTGNKGLRIGHLMQAIVDEFAENEDLPNTTNPDDWAKISGKKGERIVFIRTLISSNKGTQPGRSIDTVSNTGQYL